MASKTLRAKYPRSLAVMLTDELAGRIEADAERAGLSKAEVVRLYLEAGIAALEVDEPEDDVAPHD